jgi:phosphomannomutase
MFREYDIRGIVDRDLTDDVLELMGKSFGTFTRRECGKASPTVIVGHDARLTSARFASALIRGIRSTGCNVVMINMVPTPVMYFNVGSRNADGGICVTASHNPPQFNGLKLRKRKAGNGDPLSSADVQTIYTLIAADDFETGAGTVEEADGLTPYLDYIVSRVTLGRRVKVVVDGGNGTSGESASDAYRRAGCEVIELFTKPDGTFPNHMPNPLKEENLVDLAAKVREHGADLGIGLDGDGDRLGVVDDQGQTLWPDQYLIFLGRRALAVEKTPIVFDVKCSNALIEDIAANGGTPVMSKTGYTNIARRRAEVGGALAGEFSGHIFFGDPKHDFDDGTFAGLNLLEWVSHQSRPISSLRAELPQYVASPEERYACDDSAKFGVIERVRAHFKAQYETIDLDGVRVVMPGGWALVRASNTEPSLTSRFEATSAERLSEIMAEVKGFLEGFPEVDLHSEGH